MAGNRQSPANEHPQLSLTISLTEIYSALCPACREALIDYIAGKAGAGMVRESLRQQFELSTHPERSEGSPHVDS